MTVKMCCYQKYFLIPKLRIIYQDEIYYNSKKCNSSTYCCRAYGRSNVLYFHNIQTQVAIMRKIGSLCTILVFMKNMALTRQLWVKSFWNETSERFYYCFGINEKTCIVFGGKHMNRNSARYLPESADKFRSKWRQTGVGVVGYPAACAKCCSNSI